MGATGMDCVCVFFWSPYFAVWFSHGRIVSLAPTPEQLKSWRIILGNEKKKELLLL